MNKLAIRPKWSMFAQRHRILGGRRRISTCLPVAPLAIMNTPRPRPLTGAVHDDVRCVRVLVVLPCGQAGAVAVDHA